MGKLYNFAINLLRFNLKLKPMRKLLIFVVSLFITGSLLAGGLVTNNNQSAMFTRLQNRNASTSIDAVYFNPAGLTKLGPGFFASVNNQTITQTQTVSSDYPYLLPTPKKYIGNVSAPIFPGIYLVYNTGKLSFSAGFNPIGGGGGAKYKTGLPSFEMNIADIPPSLTYQGIPTSQYSSDIYFKGSSTYLGYQANIAYKINDKFSVAAGARLVSATNKYSGYLNNIMINPNYPAFGPGYTGGMVSASQFFTDGQTYLNGVSTQLSGTAASLQPLITGGAGGVLLSNGTAVGLTPTQVATLQGTISALGGNPGGMTIAQSQAFFTGASASYGAKAGLMGENAAASKDITVDASESGTGVTPILSANFSPLDNLNIAVKYEFKTEINLKTKVVNNEGGGIFVDGRTVIGDMPAMLSFGVDYRPVKRLLLSASFDEYFDKQVDYDGSPTININEIDKNFVEYGLGVEYGLTEKLRVSAGWAHTETGVNLNYQSDQSFSTNTNSFGGGFGYRITPMIDLNLAGQYTFYNDGKKPYDPRLSFDPNSFTETYKKVTWMIALGLDFYFGKK
jgi:long-subunit fatty acid transport protein